MPRRTCGKGPAYPILTRTNTPSLPTSTVSGPQADDPENKTLVCGAPCPTARLWALPLTVPTPGRRGSEEGLPPPRRGQETVA